MALLTSSPPDTQDFKGSGSAVAVPANGGQSEAGGLSPDVALRMAQQAYTGSSNYFDASVRGQLIENLRQFQGRFPSGSKYLSDAYRGRSKFFRNKTRAIVRKNEAIAAEAFFSSMDVVNIKAQDEDDPVQQASAEVNKELLFHRLTKKGRNSIPWFLISMGAYQDAQVQNTVCSYQYWEVNEKKSLDRPCVEVIPRENYRFDPNAKWYDPVNTSPYFIHLIPMYVKDVKARMKAGTDPDTAPKWKTVDDSVILKCSTMASEAVRLAREAGRQDPKASSNATLTEFTIVWVHRNIIEHDGQDYVFHTLGTLHLLDDPKPIEQVWFHGRRPYVIGFSVVESHRNDANGIVSILGGYQQELNENANQRMDNVKFAMNKRYFVKRSGLVDLRSLQRNVPSSSTMMNDPEKDVKVVDTPDVTSSAYEEQDRLQLDMDDMAGSFSQASVSSNRKLNETVGGMNILTRDASQLTGYGLRIFAETWMEPVLEQLILLEQYYETDATILALAGKKADVYQRFGINALTDELLMQSLTTNVNVGIGATNPHDQLQNFLTAMESLEKILASGILVRYGLDVGEATKEIFGKLGFKDGKRFFPSDDPRIQGLMSTIDELQKALDAKMPPELLAATVEKLKADAAKAHAATVETKVKAVFAAVQGAEVIAAVPQIAGVADVLLDQVGFIPANGATNIPVPAGPIEGLGISEVKNPKTGISFMPGGGAGPQAGDTDPMTPKAPATPGTGALDGIETMRADSTGPSIH